MLRYKSVVVAPRFVSLTVPGTSLSILFLYVYTYIYIYIYMSLILLNSRSNPLLLKKNEEASLDSPLLHRRLFHRRETDKRLKNSMPSEVDR